MWLPGDCIGVIEEFLPRTNRCKEVCRLWDEYCPQRNITIDNCDQLKDINENTAGITLSSTFWDNPSAITSGLVQVAAKVAESAPNIRWIATDFMNDSVIANVDATRRKTRFKQRIAHLHVSV